MPYSSNLHSRAPRAGAAEGVDEAWWGLERKPRVKVTRRPERPANLFRHLEPHPGRGRRIRELELVLSNLCRVNQLR